MSDGRLTTAQYWHDYWLAQRAPARRLSPRHAYFGADGIFLKHVRSSLGDLRGEELLELGGGGNNYRLLALHKWAGARVTAVDESPLSLNLLRDVFQKNEAAVSAVQGDFFQWRPTRTFDVVYHCGVLEHFRDPLPLLQLSSSLLRDGGKLFFTMPNMEAWAAKLWRTWSPKNWSNHILHGSEVIARACVLAGLQLQTSSYFGLPFFQISPWERSGLLPFLVARAQILATLSSRVLPVYHRVGSRRVSMERGFFAVRDARAQSGAR